THRKTTDCEIPVENKKEVKIILNTSPGIKRVYQKRLEQKVDKYIDNVRAILLNSNATPIRWKSTGYACSFCTEQFPDPADLKMHIIKKHDNKTKSNYMRGVSLEDFIVKLDITDLKCKLCDTNLDNVPDLVEHILIKHEKRIDMNNYIIPFKFDRDELYCAICFKEFNNFKILLTHMNIHFRNHICEVCGAGFICNGTLRSHGYRHMTGTFNCGTCSKVFDTKVKRRDHERAVHIHMNRRYKCAFCGERFMDHTRKKDHEVEVHGAKRIILTCTHRKTTDCEIPVENKKEVKIILNTSPGIKRVYQKRLEQEVDKYIDNVRAILLNSNATPIRWKSTGYACSFCTEQFPDPADLKMHIIKKHDDKTKSNYMRGVSLEDFIVKLDITDLKCKLCDTNLDNVPDLVEHILIKHEKQIDMNNYIIPFKFDRDELRCLICLKQFNSFKILMTHMNIHFRNHICEVCGAGFISIRTRRSHAKRHMTGTFTCGTCSKVFDTQVKRRDHERAVHIHMNRRSKCAFCGERFTDHVKKKDHEVEVHGAKRITLTCNACDKIFDNQRSLTVHSKRYHLKERRIK
ncbi:unnamed protein product, partial [Euphydryas editha]